MSELVRRKNRKPLLLKGVRQAGKADFLHLYPLSFSEFLQATGDRSLAAFLEQIDRLQPGPDAFHTLLSEKLRMHFVAGGMPSAYGRRPATYRKRSVR